jgi:hypothetical protein
MVVETRISWYIEYCVFVRLVRSVDLMFVSKETIGILVDAHCVVLPPGMVAVQFQELTRHSPFSY